MGLFKAIAKFFSDMSDDLDRWEQEYAQKMERMYSEAHAATSKPNKPKAPTQAASSKASAHQDCKRYEDDDIPDIASILTEEDFM